MLLLLFSFLALTENAEILIYNPEYEFSKSHRNFHGALADLLTDAGHDVTMYQPLTDNDTTFTGSNNPKVKIFTKKFSTKVALDYEEFQKNVWNFDPSKFGMGMLKTITQIFDEICEKQLRDSKLLTQLKSENFDLGIAEYWESCGFGIFDQIGLEKRITIFTAMIHDQLPGRAGIPILSSFVPSMMTGFTPDMTFIERFKNHISYLISELWLHRYSLSTYDLVEVMKKVTGKEFRASEKAMESSFIFINAEEHFEIPRPISHKFIYIGGFNWNNQNPLNKKYEKLFKMKKNGVILVSFGSIAKCSQMPESMKESLLNAFSEFPDHLFIWKHDFFDQIFDEKVKNVYYENWFPQKELLAHPKVVGIITHGGLNSAIEIGYSGTPAIGIPIFADQYKNAGLFKFRKTGIVLDKNELSTKTIVTALKEILLNESYKNEAKLLAEMIAEKPMPAKERILKYTEFAAKFGNVQNLDLYGKDLGLIEFYNLDIWIILLMIIVIPFVLSIIVLYKFFYALLVHTKIKTE